ncbi:MAG: polyphosphate kinase 2 family protein [Propionibacteriales bacterium]|nr:polyphosphate kinase 2 family protein [Propionibacteriales bacterium]
MGHRLTDLLRLPKGAVDLTGVDPRARPGFKGGKKAGKAALAKLGPVIADLQERLFAEAHAGGQRRVLLVLQGMDTSGKGGVMRHCVGLLDPQGVDITAFKAPTRSEKSHDFLWRIQKHVPHPGMIGIFDRSHYEDVLIAKVHDLAATDEIKRRYVAINAFERDLVDGGTTVLKCFLHISKAKQGERLLKRLEDPTKQWKFNPDDIDERARWDEYQHAYEIALRRCNTTAAPFFVIPSDRKWYRNWAITTLLLEHFSALDPQWPRTELDVREQKARLAAS